MENKLIPDNWKEKVLNTIDKFHPDFMTKEEWDRTKEEIISNLGGWEKMKSDIEIGISNGFSFGLQLDLVDIMVSSIIEESK